MSKKVLHRIEFTGVGIIVFLGFFLWLGSSNVIPNESNDIAVHGDKLIPKVQNMLDQMHYDIENCENVMVAKPYLFIFRNQNQEIKKYCYDLKTLWCNDMPLISQVNAFYFEYRDDWGNLLANSQRDLSLIESVGYTIRMQNGKNEVFTALKVNIPSPVIRNESSYNVAWASIAD